MIDVRVNSSWRKNPTCGHPTSWLNNGEIPIIMVNNGSNNGDLSRSSPNPTKSSGVISSMCQKIHHLGGSWKWRYPWWIEGKIHPWMIWGYPHDSSACHTRCSQLTRGARVWGTHLQRIATSSWRAKPGVCCRGLTNKLVLDGTFMIFHGICEDDEDDV